METKTCPFCNGEMVKGKGDRAGYARYFWKRPWGGFLSKTELAYPWLCLNCGALIPYIDKDKLERIKIEFERQRMGRL